MPEKLDDAWRRCVPIEAGPSSSWPIGSPSPASRCRTWSRASPTPASAPWPSWRASSASSPTTWCRAPRTPPPRPSACRWWWRGWTETEHLLALLTRDPRVERPHRGPPRPGHARPLDQDAARRAGAGARPRRAPPARRGPPDRPHPQTPDAPPASPPLPTSRDGYVRQEHISVPRTRRFVGREAQRRWRVSSWALLYVYVSPRRAVLAQGRVAHPSSTAMARPTTWSSGWSIGTSTVTSSRLLSASVAHVGSATPRSVKAGPLGNVP